MKKLLPTFFLFIIFLLFPNIKVSAATLNFEPSEVTNSTIGDVKKINVVLDPQGKMVSGVEVYMVASNTNIEITDLTKSSTLSSQDYQFTTFDKDKASFSVFKPAGSTSISTKTTLAILSVKVVKTGSSQLSFVTTGSNYSTIMEDATWSELLTSTGKSTISTTSSSSNDDNNDDDDNNDSDEDTNNNDEDSDSDSDSDNSNSSSTPTPTPTPIYKSSSRVPGTGDYDMPIFLAISTLLISSSIVVKRYFV